VTLKIHYLQISDLYSCC